MFHEKLYTCFIYVREYLPEIFVHLIACMIIIRRPSKKYSDTNVNIKMDINNDGDGNTKKNYTTIEDVSEMCDSESVPFLFNNILRFHRVWHQHSVFEMIVRCTSWYGCRIWWYGFNRLVMPLCFVCPVGISYITCETDHKKFESILHPCFSNIK